ncbi:Abi-alpha family protein [Bounagaea algeriensis]
MSNAEHPVEPAPRSASAAEDPAAEDTAGAEAAVAGTAGAEAADAATAVDSATEDGTGAVPTSTPDAGGDDAVTAGLRALPGVATVFAHGALRTGLWATGTSLRIGHRVVQGTLSGESANAVLEQVADEARESVRSALGMSDLPDPLPKVLRERVEANGGATSARRLSVAERFAALLDASNEVHGADGEHPAYVRLVSELAPDEARILRLFAHEGAQAAVDVRAKRAFGSGGRLVARGITMIGQHAGCRYCDRVPSYLDNLLRLGLVVVSREPLPEQSVYDVLEIQPAVTDALHEVGRGFTRRYRIELTAFGRDLCTVVGLPAQ